ncbi:GSCOCG00012622001-RA-CDS [Cotesia congregata]|uniref:Uncharacterized protein n=1 Tax=Cotesia congregata TaxID=51543 RepID=A0A8J2H7J0_COTCN|nr:GSCOCG00012622001-RA-CDS [Cotesia congregata]CAG5079660.1 Protein of unknown function [Cotesia congregata]
MENSEKNVSTETIPIDLSRTSKTVEQHDDPSLIQHAKAYHGIQNQPVVPNFPQFHHVPHHQVNQQPQQIIPNQHQVMFVPQPYYTYPSSALNHSVPPYNYTPNLGVQYMPSQFGGTVGTSAHSFQHPVMPQSFYNDQLSGKSDGVPVVLKEQANCESTWSDKNQITSGGSLSSSNNNNSNSKNAMTNPRTTQVTRTFSNKESGKPNLSEIELLKICKQKSAVEKENTGTYRRRNFNCRNNCTACQDFCQRDCVRCRCIENLDKLL